MTHTVGTEWISPAAGVVDAATGARVAGADLISAVERVAHAIEGLPPGAVFARTALDTDSVLRYLGAFCAGRPVAVLDPALDPVALAELVGRFEPAAVVGLDEGGPGAETGDLPKGYRALDVPELGRIWRRDEPTTELPHPDLAVLLTTSGSTGNPKLVRQSRGAVLANARAIADILQLGPAEVAPTSLPLFYTYGLSVLNSHLVGGGTVLIADGGVLAAGFWQAVDRYGGTSLAGVPYNYEMLARIRWNPAKHPSLRTLTQAGGRLRPELIGAFHEKITAVGGRMYVMYGQTEATARMTILPAERLADKLGSVGPAVPGGALSVRTTDGELTDAPRVTGEVVFRGPNVMMGYAETAADLARGDDHDGVLHTGDIGYLDEDGYLFLTGRLKRIGKVFGVRVSLDDIEKILRAEGPVAAVAAGDKVVVWCEGLVDGRGRELTSLLAERLRLHRSGFDVRTIDTLPLLGNGKVDYRALEARS